MSGHLVLADAAPDNGMRNDRICSDKDECVGQLQIFERVTGGVIAEALFVADRCRSHAQARISVHVGLQVVSHHMAEDRELLQCELACTDTGNTLSSVFCLKLLDLVSNMFESFVPGDLFHGPVCLPDLGQRIGLYRRLLFAQ